jgi:hypothetical protein
MNLFDEVSLYGALVHVVAEGVDAYRTQIETALHTAGAMIQSMDVIAPSLEDVFIAGIQEHEDETRRPAPGAP